MCDEPGIETARNQIQIYIKARRSWNFAGKMAFSLSKMLKNITYFKKPEGDVSRPNDCPDDTNAIDLRHGQLLSVDEPSEVMSYIHTEPDSTSNQTAAAGLKLPESVKNFADKEGSLSDTNLLNINVSTVGKKEKNKAKNLKLDIDRANKSLDESLNHSGSEENDENTPKHCLLESKSAEIFSQRMKELDFSQSFDLFAAIDEEESTCEEETLDIESLTDSDMDISLSSSEEVQMCRKVAKIEHNQSSAEEENQIIPSATPESFGDVEIDKNEEERITLLLNYQMRLEKMECFLKKLLNEFQFHIEVSKVFNCRSIVTTLPGTNVNDIPKKLGEITYIDNISRGNSPSWNIVMEREDDLTKQRLRNQLISIKQAIEKFVNDYLNFEVKKAKSTKNSRSIAFDFSKEKKVKRLKISNKKKTKRYDFPDIREAMINLFGSESDKEDFSISGNNITQLLSDDDDERSKCVCRCHVSGSPVSETDSGVTKSNERSLSITSSIGNFSLDSSTLTAYSESLDQVISYNSFQDTSLFSAILQRAAIERVTFYVQVHSIQLRCETSEQEFESKNVIKFHCPACNSTENDESGLLRHIVSQYHCEKIHFLYKTAYIKKCMQAGKEIQPSTVLNPMKMYRDDNKIVCFGDAVYACSLCFENMIVGESVLMAHCGEADHVDRRERLCELLD